MLYTLIYHHKKTKMISDLQKIGKVLKYLPHFRLFTKIYVINKILHYLKKI